MSRSPDRTTERPMRQQRLGTRRTADARRVGSQPTRALREAALVKREATDPVTSHGSRATTSTRNTRKECHLARRRGDRVGSLAHASPVRSDAVRCYPQTRGLARRRWDAKGRPVFVGWALAHADSPFFEPRSTQDGLRPQAKPVLSPSRKEREGEIGRSFLCILGDLGVFARGSSTLPRGVQPHSVQPARTTCSEGHNTGDRNRCSLRKWTITPRRHCPTRHIPPIGFIFFVASTSSRYTDFRKSLWIHLSGTHLSARRAALIRSSPTDRQADTAVANG